MQRQIIQITALQSHNLQIPTPHVDLASIAKLYNAVGMTFLLSKTWKRDNILALPVP